MLCLLLRLDGKTEARIPLEFQFFVLPRMVSLREESATSILDFLVYFQSYFLLCLESISIIMSFCHSSLVVFEMVGFFK